MRKRFAFVAATVALLALTAAGHGQTAPQTTFRTGIDLIRIDVSVLDRHRRPVRGLSAGDFTLRVDGEPQPILAFAPMEAPEPEEPSAAWMREIASDVVSNTLEDRRLVLILMDDATSAFGGNALTNGRKIAQRAIDALGPADLAAVAFTFDGRLQEFTSDRARLRAAVDSFHPRFFRPGPGSPTGLAGPPVACAGGVRGAGPPGGCGVDLLRHVATVLAGAPPGRKMVIYVGSVPIPPINSTDPESMDALSPAMVMLRALQRANITVYTFDPDGLTSDRAPDPSLRTLAEHTGGRAVTSTPVPWEHVLDAFRENSAYYLLGFNGRIGPANGRFRKVEVRVNVSDADVRTRSGYDIPLPPKPSTKASPSAIDLALAQGLPAGDLPMFATAAPFASAVKEGAEVAVVVRIPESRTASPGTAPNAAVTRRVNVVATAVNAARRFQGALTQAIDVTLRPDARAGGEYEVISRLPLEPGRYQIRFAAETASQMGTVFLDVDVPDFARAALSLSGLVLQKTPGLQVAPADALAAFIPLIPTSVRDLARTDRVAAFVRVHQGGTRTLMPVVVATQIRNDADVAVYDVAATLGPDRFAAHRAADHLVDIPMARLAPGPYVLSIEAALAKTTLRRDLRFIIR
jgi:VWFA-related protein